MLEGLKYSDPDIHYAEYKYFDEKYGIGDAIAERKFCIISPFKNLLTTPSSLQYYLLSLSEQNYT